MEQATRTGKRRGFSLLELMIAMAIISILVGVAIPIYRTMILSSREKTLKVNLHTLRDVIDQYTADKKKAPQVLQDLVDAGYFRTLPVDPMTGSTSTWETIFDTSVSLPDQTESGITDVRSGSNLVSTEGTAYNTW